MVIRDIATLAQAEGIASSLRGHNENIMDVRVRKLPSKQYAVYFYLRRENRHSTADGYKVECSNRQLEESG